MVFVGTLMMGRIYGKLMSELPCKVSRKLIKYPTKKKDVMFFIRNITKIGEAVYDTVSIYGKDGRYLTDDFIVMQRDRIPEPNMNPYVDESSDSDDYESLSKYHLSDYNPSSSTDFVNPLSTMDARYGSIC